MKKIIHAYALTLILLIACEAGAAIHQKDARLAPIEDPLLSTFASNPPVGRQKIKAAIVSAAASHDWRVVSETEGRTMLTTTVRGKHVINLEVDYGDNGFQFLYLNSLNLMYLEEGSRRLIHHNYNVWIKDLAASINSNVGSPATITVGSTIKRQRMARADFSASSSAPAYVASGYAAIDNIEAVPVRAEFKEEYQRYLTKRSPKAFAISDKGGWQASWGNVDASRKVLAGCEERKMKCWLYAVDDKVVWNADPEKRVGNALQPKTVP